MSSEASKPNGMVYTFYSFKGGVGRSMALANVAALLAKWGHRVLVVDWDLEAPGLEHYFAVDSSDAKRIRSNYPGVIDLVLAKRDGRSLSWKECVIKLDSDVALVTAGCEDGHYSDKVHGLDLNALFEKKDLGGYIETIRKEWISEYDFVLIDSRTGITDIGGICTVHLPDVLVLFFTANDSSIEGTREIFDRARIAHEKLPLPRGRLIAVPVPARDESRTEYTRASEWKRVFASRFSDVYQDWLPLGIKPVEAVDILKIPYVPYWSFGEQLPVLMEKSTDPTSITAAYETLARLLATRLGWYEALKGRARPPVPQASAREISKWVERQRVSAVNGFNDRNKSRNFGRRGFFEFYHYCIDSDIVKSQSELLEIAELSAIHTFGWPIGIVLRNREDLKPRPTNEGIVAKVDTDHDYDYWALSTHGDFYTLMSLFEDSRVPNSIFYNTRIVRTTEAVLHCVKIYEAFGVPPSSTVEMTIRYEGLGDRRLSAASLGAVITQSRSNSTEDAISVTTTFQVALSLPDVVAVVKRFCEPLFIIFDFAKYPDSLYEDIVKQFIQGTVI